MKPKHKVLAISGGVLIAAGPLLGLLATILGMQRSMAALNASGVKDARALASEVGTTLLMTVLGCGVGVVGIVLLVIGLTLARRDRLPDAPRAPLINSARILPASAMGRA